MKFNDHSQLAGKHALLSASQYAWIRYDDAQLIDKIANSMAAVRGTETHAFACLCIQRGQRLPANKRTLNSFVNDAINFKMKPEQIVHYSDNCYGTADALNFKTFRGNDLPTLQIFDLKTGKLPAKVDQLLIYAAMFCLEYKMKAFDILYDLRIYQSDEIAVYDVDPVEVAEIMAKIIHFDKLIEEVKAAESDD